MAIAERTHVSHPLEPVTPAEITEGVAILARERLVRGRRRIQGIELVEPEKEVVLAFQPRTTVERALRFILLDQDSGSVEEITVLLNEGKVEARYPIREGQPPISLEEFDEAEALCKRDARYLEALRKRGISDASGVIVDLYGAGSYGDGADGGRRLARGLSWLRLDPDDNPYAHPIDNVHVVVDLNRMEVVDVEDYGVLPVPQERGPYESGTQESRTDLKPLEIVQPEGVSFTLEGYELAWQKWRMRLGFTMREGLVLHDVRYHDAGRDRPILYRASLSEQLTPYGDPRESQWRKNAFDEGEYNMGSLANSLALGCDCLGEVRYLDAAWCDSSGGPVVLKNAICIHEEDAGILWKHHDFRRNRDETRRSRRLVVSMICTIANYDYGFYWYFYQDGTIEYEIKITGIMSTAVSAPGGQPTHGQLLNPEGLYGPIHQHVFNVRLDMTVDGSSNSVYEVNTCADPRGPNNPHLNGYRSHLTPLRTELEARRVIDPMQGRYWRIVNPQRLNWIGEPVAYDLIPGLNLLPFADPTTSVRRRGGFMDYNLWVTPYRSNERFAAGDYPNQHPGGDGLPAWTAADRPIEETNIVLWYTLQNLHAARLEDWPIIQLTRIGFHLRPHGFFDENPAIDVPPPPAHCMNHPREEGVPAARRDE